MINEHDSVCPCSTPKFSIIRLCEGRSIMLTPRCAIQIHPDHVENKFNIISRFENEFVKIMWCDVQITLYRTGSMMFYHMNDKETAEIYATDILRKLDLLSSDNFCGTRNTIEIGEIE